MHPFTPLPPPPFTHVLLQVCQRALRITQALLCLAACVPSCRRAAVQLHCSSQVVQSILSKEWDAWSRLAGFTYVRGTEQSSRFSPTCFLEPRGSSTGGGGNVMSRPSLCQRLLRTIRWAPAHTLGQHNSPPCTLRSPAGGPDAATVRRDSDAQGRCGGPTPAQHHSLRQLPRSGAGAPAPLHGCSTPWSGWG